MKKLIFTLLGLVIFLSTSVVYAQEVTCVDCSDCTSKLDGSSTYVRLTQDITVPTGINPCVNFGADNIVFDCDGHRISGRREIGVVGINAKNKKGITIQNCVLENFGGKGGDAGYKGGAINLTYTIYSFVLNNKLSTVGDGIYLEHSSYNEIKDNTVFDSGYTGIAVLYESNNNYVKNNRIKGAWHCGIASCLDVKNNFLEDNIILKGDDKGQYIVGICLCGTSYDNILNNNFACFNRDDDIHVTEGCSGTGNNNACDKPNGWKDADRSRCTYKCKEVWIGSDMNRDGKVNIVDIAIVAKAFGSKPGNPKWNSDADMDENGIINIIDVAKVAKNFGKGI